MELNNVKDVLALLLIKKNNFSITEHERNLINELEFLIRLAKNQQSIASKEECQCTLNENTIALELTQNQCFECGLPLTIA
jgi:hypothetical protein